MADYITPATELDAVNLMLRSFADTRVNSLSGELPLDAAEALETLQEVLRDIQTKGWYWNTEYLRLIPDTNGDIKLPPNTLEIDTINGSEGIPVTIRSGKLYRLTPFDSGFSWTGYSSVELELVLGLSFEDMPPAGKALAYHKASRIFVARQEGDQIALKTASDEETMALSELRRKQNRARPQSMRRSASMQSILARGVDTMHNNYGQRTFLRRSR